MGESLFWKLFLFCCYANLNFFAGGAPLVLYVFSFENATASDELISFKRQF